MYMHDQHVHSKYSMDSNEELEKYYQIAVSKGCNILSQLNIMIWI